MAASLDRQPKFAQRKRIFPHREEIYRLLDHGYPVREIRGLIKLDDIPLRTFEKNVAALRKERSLSAETTAPSTEIGASEDQSASPAPSANLLKVRKKKKGPAIVHPDFALPKGRDAKPDERPTLKPSDYM